MPSTSDVAKALHHAVQDGIVRTLIRYPRRAALRGRRRVFAVGLSRTGTLSLTQALQRLGLRTKHFPIDLVDLRRTGLHFRMTEVAEYEALTDTPIARFFKELDGWFPGSKFILTTRETDSWLRSCSRTFERSSWGSTIDQLHADLYGSTVFDRGKFAAAYVRHEHAVLSYFQNRPSDLLVLNICGGEGWKKLCPFLQLPEPNEPFPLANRTRDIVQP